MRTIKNLWCSVHQPTPEQKKDLKNGKNELIFLKNINPKLQEKINDLKVDSDLNLLAEKLVQEIIKGGYTPIQVGGSPAFIFAVGRIYGEMNSPLSMERSPERPRFSYTKRISEDIPQEDGTTKKISVFKHEGWV
jgi:hypothetical protein